MARLILLLAYCLLFSPLAHAQFSPATTLIAGEEVKSILDKAQSTIGISIDHAQEAGNGLISNEATQLSILIKNADLVLGSNVTGLVRQLGPNEANLLGQISQLTNELKTAQDRAYYIRDVSIVDISNLSATLPFTKVPFFVQKVNGVAQVLHNSDYKLQIVARGIEIASSNVSSTVEFKIKGQSLPSRISVTQNGVADIFIDSSQLARFFNAEKVQIVPAEIDIKIVQHAPKKFFRKPADSVINLAAPIWLSLYPKKAGEITVTATWPRLVWVPTARTDGISEPVDSNTPHRYEVRVAGGASSDTPGALKLANPTLTCNQTWSGDMKYCGSGAYWGYSQVPTLTQDDQVATAVVSNHGEQLWFSIHADTYKLAVAPVPNQESNKYSLEWDTPVTITLPWGWSDYQISGMTITNQPIQLHQNTSMDHFLTFENLGPVPPKPNRQILNYRVGSPQ